MAKKSNNIIPIIILIFGFVLIAGAIGYIAFGDNFNTVDDGAETDNEYEMPEEGPVEGIVGDGETISYPISNDTTIELPVPENDTNVGVLSLIYTSPDIPASFTLDGEELSFKEIEGNLRHDSVVEAGTYDFSAHVEGIDKAYNETINVPKGLDMQPYEIDLTNFVKKQTNESRFTIAVKDKEEQFPLEGIIIEIDNNQYQTNADGEINVFVPNGVNTAHVSDPNGDYEDKTIDLNEEFCLVLLSSSTDTGGGENPENDNNTGGETTDPENDNEIYFLVTSSETGEELEGISVFMDGFEVKTDANGIARIVLTESSNLHAKVSDSNDNYETKEFVVTDKYNPQSGKVEVQLDDVSGGGGEDPEDPVDPEDEYETYNVNFYVYKDAWYGLLKDDIAGATVRVQGNDFVTNNKGKTEVEFRTKKDLSDIDFKVSKDGFNMETSNFGEHNIDNTIEIELTEDEDNGDVDPTKPEFDLNNFERVSAYVKTEDKSKDNEIVVVKDVDVEVKSLNSKYKLYDTKTEKFVDSLTLTTDSNGRLPYDRIKAHEKDYISFKAKENNDILPNARILRNDDKDKWSYWYLNVVSKKAAYGEIGFSYNDMNNVHQIKPELNKIYVDDSSSSNLLLKADFFVDYLSSIFSTQSSEVRVYVGKKTNTNPHYDDVPYSLEHKFGIKPGYGYVGDSTSDKQLFFYDEGDTTTYYMIVAYPDVDYSGGGPAMGDMDRNLGADVWEIRFTDNENDIKYKQSYVKEITNYKVDEIVN